MAEYIRFDEHLDFVVSLELVLDLIPRVTSQPEL